MNLYTYFRSSASFRLRIALAHKGLAHTQTFVNLPKGEQRSALFLKVNPQGLVPALTDDAGQVYTQSLAMIEWLDETHPEPALLPKTARERWYVRALSQIIGCEMHPLNNLRVLKYLRSAYGLTEAQVSEDWYPHWIAEGFTGFEAMLASENRAGSYCLGEQVTMADVCLVPQVFNAERYKCDLSAFPRLTSIHRNLMQLPAFANAVPMAQGDAVG